MLFLSKCVFLALHEPKVKNGVFSNLLSAGTQKVSISIQDELHRSVCLANKQKIAISHFMGKTLGDPDPSKEGCTCGGGYICGGNGGGCFSVVGFGGSCSGGCVVGSNDCVGVCGECGTP